jgi:hypothetical protein
VGAVKNNQRGVGWFGEGTCKNDDAAVVSFAGQAQVFGAKRRATSNEIVYYFVEKGKVWHRFCGEAFQMPGWFVNGDS